jgi:protein-disulfide isomerase
MHGTQLWSLGCKWFISWALESLNPARILLAGSHELVREGTRDSTDLTNPSIESHYILMKNIAALLTLCAISFGSAAAQTRSRGVAIAPIRIEVYSDFQCPACKALYERTLVPLASAYVDTGKVFLVHHEFPLPMHPHAAEAANYACAAARVGKYEQVADVLFRQQDSWAVTGKVDEMVCSVLTPTEAKKVRALVKDPSIQAEVQQDYKFAMDAKVAGTPTMILTHRLKQYNIPANTSYDMLRKFMDQLLAN